MRKRLLLLGLIALMIALVLPVAAFGADVAVPLGSPELTACSQ